MTTIRYALATALMTLALAACGTPVPAPSVPPCPTEDSAGCYWDAATMGNGTGRSFTVDADGSVHYWND